MGPLTCGGRPYFSSKKLATFIVITVCELSVLQCHPYLFTPEKLATFFGAHYFWHVAVLQKIAAPFVGAPLCGGPCSAEQAEHA